MKTKFISLIAIMMIAISTHAQKQFLYSIKTGSNLSMIKGLETTNFNKEFGFHGGLGVEYLKNGPLGIKAELLYETKGFKNFSNTVLMYKTTYYNNDVKENSLYIPILLNYHFKKMSIEFGPHFDFLLSSSQKEVYHSLWTDGSNKETFEEYTNQHHFSKINLGVNFGFNFDIYQKIKLTTRFTQYFTNLGYEYPWQKFSLLQLSLGYTIGKDYTPRKIEENNKEEFSQALKSYSILQTYGFSKVELHKVSKGNKIIIQFYKLNANYEITDILIQESSGFEVRTFSQVEINDVQFPFRGKITLTLKQKINSTISESTTEFEIYEDGVWNIVLSH